MKIIVIGGGASGMMFSVQYKKSNPDDEVIVFEKSEFVSWAGCPTPYYISNELSFDHVVMGSPESFIKRGIDVNINHEVEHIDFVNKKIFVEGSNYSGEVEYDKLILAIGAKTFIPNFKGYEDGFKNAFTLSHAESAIKIKEYITNEYPKNAVIIGSGLIGVEMAESFEKNNLNVTLIEKNDDIFPRISKNLKEPLYSLFSDKKIDLKLSTEVEEILSEDKVCKSIILTNGEKIDCDIVLFSTGITPNIDFINKGIHDLDIKNNKIVVNNKFETSIKNVYAIGDSINNKYYNTDKDVYTPLGDVANKHGMLLARYLSGKEISWNGVLRSHASSFYDLKFAQTGMTLDEAIANGIDAEIINMKAMYKNSGFDDSKPSNVEVVYDKKNKIVLGATMVGYEAVAQFIDQFSIVITLKTPIEKFIEIDFCYSPTNASVWNPLLVTYRKVIR